MPVINHWEANGLCIEYSGTVSSPELFESVQELSSDPRFDSIRYILSDWGGSSPTQRTTDDIEKLTHYVNALAKTNPAIVNAVVTPPNDESRQALAAFYVMLAGDRPWKTDCFGSMAEARAWIENEL